MHRFSTSRPAGLLAALLLVLIAPWGLGCTGQVSRSAVDLPPTVVLVSLDGFRWDYLDLYDAPNLRAVASEGVWAERLIPVFPSKTFPNHYTTVTGLYPEHHGIVSNTMYDPEFDASFSLGNDEAVRDARWWGGEPIWVTAEKQGQIAATYFWPGSEAAIHDVRPTYWMEYDGRVPNAERVRHVLDWLDLPAGKRPTLVTLYFSNVDSRGHAHGPISEEVETAVRDADRRIGELVAGLRERGLYDDVDLIITSDHGMAETSPERVILLDDYVDVTDLHIVEYSPVLQARPAPGREAAVYEALKKAPHLRVYRKGEIPERLHYRAHRRIAPIVAIADEGWEIATRARFEADPARFEGGAHGYDPAARSMGGVFIAHGPSFREGARVGPFSNVHLYNLMASILHLVPAPNDGSLDSVRVVLDQEAVVP